MKKNTCDNCGVSFSAEGSRLFCSRKCFDRFKNKKVALAENEKKPTKNRPLKLTAEQALQIKKLYNSNGSVVEIARTYYISTATVISIGENLSWKHVKLDSDLKRKKRTIKQSIKLTEDQVREIKSMYREGVKTSVISNQFHIHQRTVRQIGKNLSWKHIGV